MQQQYQVFGNIMSDLTGQGTQSQTFASKTNALYKFVCITKTLVFSSFLFIKKSLKFFTRYCTLVLFNTKFLNVLPHIFFSKAALNQRLIFDIVSQILLKQCSSFADSAQTMFKFRRYCTNTVQVCVHVFSHHD